MKLSDLMQAFENQINFDPSIKDREVVVADSAAQQFYPIKNIGVSNNVFILTEATKKEED